MSRKQNLEKVMKEKINPILDSAMEKYLGVKIEKINEDISDKISISPMINYSVHTELPFKTAKKMFKKEFLTKIIQTHYCNISKVADILDVNRRSLHRLIKDLDINIETLRDEMLRPTYYKQEMVDNVLRGVFDNYKTLLHPKKLQVVYDNVEKISEDIAKELSGSELTLKQAEEMFEREFIKQALKDNEHNLTRTSKAIKIRYETLIRKMKRFGL